MALCQIYNHYIISLHNISYMIYCIITWDCPRHSAGAAESQLIANWYIQEWGRVIMLTDLIRTR